MPELTERYGIGEGSVVVLNNKFYLYYSYKPWWAEGYFLRAESTDGKNFTNEVAITPGTQVPEGANSIDVKYIPGWQTWIMVTDRKTPTGWTGFVWNVSRDGIHWLPYDTARSFNVPHAHATQMGLQGNEAGHIGNGTLASTQATTVVYAGGTSSDPLTWDLRAVDITLTPQPLTGHFDGIDANKYAFGWAYDPDTCTNDAAANGGPSAPLGHDTRVRAVLVHSVTGARYESTWRTAALTRADLVNAGATPDPYHGFSIDLKTLGVPSGTYTGSIDGGEFASGMGARTLTSQRTVTLP